MKSIFSSLLLPIAGLLCLASMTGCKRDRTAQEAPAHDTAAAPPGVVEQPPRTPAPVVDSAVVRPETKAGKIMVEGKEQSMQLKLAGKGLPFTTYVPEDMVAVEKVTGEAMTLRVHAAFGGKETKNAYMEILVPTGTTSSLEVSGLVLGSGGVVEKNKWQVSNAAESTTRCPWAVNTFSIEKKGFTGYICVGSHEGQGYYVLVYYPSEFADGFGPRADLVMSEMVWEKKR